MLKKLWDHLEEILGAFILMVMAVITFANVLTRYLITYPLAFTEEITINMFVWIVLLGTAIAFRQNAHLAMSFFYDLMPRPIKKFFFLISTLMSLTFFALLIWLGSIQIWDEYSLGVTSPSLAIPAWLYSIAVPVFSALIIFRILQAARATVRDQSW
ncbi:MAG: TRAP transporter small permease [Fretibacterium sp.]|nr:TRAP transporter small permease [Fretibacterium sp.]